MLVCRAGQQQGDGDAVQQDELRETAAGWSCLPGRPAVCRQHRGTRHPQHSTPSADHPTRPSLGHLRALLRRQRKGFAGLQQRLLPPGGLLWQQVAGELGVDDARVQRVGCGRGAARGPRRVAEGRGGGRKSVWAPAEVKRQHVEGGWSDWTHAGQGWTPQRRDNSSGGTPPAGPHLCSWRRAPAGAPAHTCAARWPAWPARRPSRAGSSWWIAGR